VLIVDDEPALRLSLAEHFSLHSEFDPDQAASAAEAEAKLAAAAGARPHDAILLDTELPDEAGREVCARLRGRGLKMPISLARFPPARSREGPSLSPRPRRPCRAAAP
jgi:DNA-binding response OmpR family regulator